MVARLDLYHQLANLQCCGDWQKDRDLGACMFRLKAAAIRCQTFVCSVAVRKHKCHAAPSEKATSHISVRPICTLLADGNRCVNKVIRKAVR